MHQFQISLNTIDKVKEFVNVSEQMPFEVRVRSQDSERTVDACSVLGVLSLPLTNALTVIVPTVLDEKQLTNSLRLVG